MLKLLFVIAGLGLSIFHVQAACAADALAGHAGAKPDLPQSEGRELMLRACTKCHDLGGLDAYKGYWNREQWKAMVDGMVKNGAELKPEEQDIVTDYLTRHFGPGTRQ